MITKDVLKTDEKSLRDIATVLAADGKFQALPGVLNEIADDICAYLEGKENHTEVFVGSGSSRSTFIEKVKAKVAKR